ncbi:MAG: hypothetical protein QXP98_04685 [Thermoproteus sp.]
MNIPKAKGLDASQTGKRRKDLAELLDGTSGELGAVDKDLSTEWIREDREGR